MPALTDLLATGVLLVVATQTAIAVRGQPDALRALVDLWRSGPWARQIFLDFYGLEAVLALWMVSHASQTGEWLPAAVCLVAMPVFGAMGAAAYWLWAV